MATPDDRLTLVERAQLLHDATLHRHGEILDRHMDQLLLLADLVARQQQTHQDLATLLSQHHDRMDVLHQTLAAIKDLLERRNGR